MLHRFERLPRRERGASYLRTYRRHRCDLLAVGHCRKTPDDGYDFHNEARYEDALVFQYTADGQGLFYDADADVTHEMTPGRAFLIPAPSPTA